MDTIFDYAQQSELALAAYANLYKNISDQDYKSALRNSGFADTQADAFFTRYSVVDQFSPSNGLSVTVFEDKQTNQKYLAVRGTNDFWNDIVAADGLNIAILGGTTFMSQYHSLVNKVIEWQLDGTLPSSYTVAGHSLGGFLAAALTNANPNNISHAYLYNAPGFGGLDESWLAGLSWVTPGMITPTRKAD